LVRNREARAAEPRLASHHDDPDASLAFWRDVLGFEVRSDVGRGKMRWITVGPKNQPETSILLAPPTANPGITDDERRAIAEMMAKGTYGWIMLAPPLPAPQRRHHTCRIRPTTPHSGPRRKNDQTGPACPTESQKSSSTTTGPTRTDHPPTILNSLPSPVGSSQSPTPTTT